MKVLWKQAFCTILGAQLEQEEVGCRPQKTKQTFPALNFPLSSCWVVSKRQHNRSLYQEWPPLSKEEWPSKLLQSVPSWADILLGTEGQSTELLAGKQCLVSHLQLPFSCQQPLTLSICCCCCCCCRRYCCCCWSGSIWLGRIPEGTPWGPKWFIPVIMGACCIDWWGNLQGKRMSPRRKKKSLTASFSIPNPSAAINETQSSYWCLQPVLLHCRNVRDTRHLQGLQTTCFSSSLK